MSDTYAVSVARRLNTLKSSFVRTIATALNSEDVCVVDMTIKVTVVKRFLNEICDQIAGHIFSISWFILRYYQVTPGGKRPVQPNVVFPSVHACLRVFICLLQLGRCKPNIMSQSTPPPLPVPMGVGRIFSRGSTRVFFQNFSRGGGKSGKIRFFPTRKYENNLFLLILSKSRGAKATTALLPPPMPVSMDFIKTSPIPVCFFPQHIAQRTPRSGRAVKRHFNCGLHRVRFVERLVVLVQWFFKFVIRRRGRGPAATTSQQKALQQSHAQRSGVGCGQSVLGRFVGSHFASGLKLSFRFIH